MTSIETYETQAKDYLETSHLTQDFFCEYNPDADYVMEFITTDNLTYPVCMRVGTTKIPSRELWIQARMHTMQEMGNIGTRVSQFETMVNDYLKMELKYRTTFDRYLVEVDPNIVHHLQSMDDLIVNINKELHVCLEHVYSEHSNSLLRMNNQMCEPLDDILQHIKKNFYPKVFAMEEVFADAKNRQKASTWMAWLKSGISALFKKISAAAQKFKSMLLAASSFLFTHSKPALDMFTRVVGQNMRDAKQWICATTHPTNRLKLYTMFGQTLHTIIKSSVSVRTTIRNRLRSFCDKYHQKLIPYMENMAEVVPYENRALFNTIDNSTEGDTKDFSAAKRAYIEYFKQFKEALGQGFCKGINLFGDDGLSDERVVALTWFICVTVVQTLEKLLGYSMKTMCGVDKEDEKVKAIKLDSTNESFDAQKYIAQQEQIKETAVAEVEMQESIQIQPKLQEALEKSGELMASVQKKMSALTKGPIQITSNTLSTLLETLIRFFLYFSDHGYLGGTDVENNNVDEKFSMAETLKDWDVKKKFEDVKLLHTIPKHVRYAYCKAQNNTPQDCADFVEYGQPIFALANAERRFKEYLDNAKVIKDGEKLSKMEEVLQTPEEIDDMLADIMSQVKSKQPKPTEQTKEEKDSGAQLRFAQKVAGTTRKSKAQPSAQPVTNVPTAQTPPKAQPPKARVPKAQLPNVPTPLPQRVANVPTPLPQRVANVPTPLPQRVAKVQQPITNDDNDENDIF